MSRATAATTERGIHEPIPSPTPCLPLRWHQSGRPPRSRSPPRTASTGPSSRRRRRSPTVESATGSATRSTPSSWRSWRPRACEPAPEADRATLHPPALSFDLTGLPPTPAEIDAFLADRAPDAYEKVVDRLLASPPTASAGRSTWLDLARYADTDGFEFDQARPDAWRYRDWVVAALNGDMPYDEFVRRQLAGDEVAPDDPSAFVATGFNRCYPDMVDLNDQGLRRRTR